MKKPVSRTVRVIRKQQLTPSFIRVTLGGDELTDFPVGNEGNYLKLLFSQGAGQKKAMRTYTIRHHRPELNELDIDFVCHAEAGVASCWAQQAKPGDALEMVGPGKKKYINYDADWFLILADMTALPAAAVLLENLPDSAKGYAIFEVRDKHDILPLTIPAGIETKWLLHDDCKTESGQLLDAAKALPWLAGTPYLFAAAENHVIRKIRRYAVCEKGLERKAIYVSSYWKIGMQEEQHKVVKTQDAQLQLTM